MGSSVDDDLNRGGLYWTITLKMADQERSDSYVVFTIMLCGYNFCV